MKLSAITAMKMLATALSVALVSAGASAQNTPPQINAYQDEQPVWNTSTGFGPVPAKLQQVGDAECRKFKYDRAVGYSAKTLNPDGKTFQKGGFMCQNDPKSNN